MVPDINIKIRLKTTEEGGRKSPIIDEIYSCPLFIDGIGYDCRLLINGKLDLGKFYEIPVKFLDLNSILPKLVIGKKVTLWEGKEIGDGQITKIL